MGRRLADGGFAQVFQAYDTIQGIEVALKVPHPHLIDDDIIRSFRKEVRITAQLDHPNILPIKDAAFIDDHFVIVQPLGMSNLAERLKKRISVRTALAYTEQLLEALAHAHDKQLIHCDVKPENVIIFPDNRLRLADFGIAKFAYHTMTGSGSGTVGYVAPEQAMGKPSLRSDVFSLGLLVYRMFAGQLPEWPFRWPPPGVERVRRKLHPDLLPWLRRTIEVDSSKRFENAGAMRRAFLWAKPRMMSLLQRRARRRYSC